MEATNGEITLYDLLAWEPRLKIISPHPSRTAASDLLSRDVEWVLTARASSPMLPLLRGGELIILPNRIVHETGIPFARLVNELTMHPIAGILAEYPVPDLPTGNLAILGLPGIEPETEGDLNRLLASHRRELLQHISETDRIIADAVEHRIRPGALIDTLSRHLGVPISILTDYDAVLFSTGAGANMIPVDARHSREWFAVPLKSDQTLWIGPIPPENHARVRMSVDRVRTGVQRLLDHDATVAPRGSARASALNALLVPDRAIPRDTIADQAFRAGIAPGRTIRVSLAPPEIADVVARRLLSSLGETHDAGDIDGYRARILIAAPGTDRVSNLIIEEATDWIAISAPVTSARDIPDAARQARYLARLLESGALASAIVRFDDDARLGVYRLLYDHWETPALRHFQTALLGTLIREDRHGLLQETLRIFLEEGGSLRPTADRLGIHRNTLAYRLKQIRSILDADLDSPHARLSLLIALVAATLPNVSS